MTSSISTFALLPLALDDVTTISGGHDKAMIMSVTMTTVYNVWTDNPVTENGTEAGSFPPTRRFFNSQISRILQVVAIAVLDIFCLFGNGLLILTINRCRELRSISNILILNLALIGILLSLTVLPTWAVTSWSQTLQFSGVLCQVSAMIMFLLFLEAILTLSGVAADRYGNICHPFRYPIFISNWKALIFISLTWLISLALSVLPLVGFGRYAFGISEVSICTIDFGHDIYFSLLTLLLVIVPACFTIFICYGKIFAVARNQARKVRNLETSISQNNPPTTENKPENVSNGKGPSNLHVPGPSAASSPKPPPRPRHKLWEIAARTVKNSVRQSRAFRTVFTIIGCFLACWTPYIVLIFYAIASHNKPSHALEFVITYLALANYVANPIICVTMNREFRKGVRKVFGLHRRRLLEDVISAWTATALQLARNASRAGSRAGSRRGSKAGGSGTDSKPGSRRNSQTSSNPGSIALPGDEAYKDSV